MCILPVVAAVQEPQLAAQAARVAAHLPVPVWPILVHLLPVVAVQAATQAVRALAAVALLYYAILTLI
jgi:hypothetical protein